MQRVQRGTSFRLASLFVIGCDLRNNLRKVSAARVARTTLPRLNLCHPSETGCGEVLRPADAYIRVAAN